MCAQFEMPCCFIRLVRCSFTKLQFGKEQNASGLKKKVIITSLCSLCYQVRKVRSDAIWGLRMSTTSAVLQRIRQEVKGRMNALYSSHFDEWCRFLFFQISCIVLPLFLRDVASPLHMKSELRQPFLEGGPLFHTDAIMGGHRHLRISICTLLSLVQLKVFIFQKKTILNI